MNDSFAYKGFFWLPNFPQNKIAGLLKYEPQEYIELDLIGTFGKDLNIGIRHHEIVNGILGNRLVALYNVDEKYRSYNLGGSGFSNYRVGYIFLDIHADKISDLKFHKLTSEFDYLEEWINKNESFKINYDQKNYEVKIAYKPPTPIIANIGRQLNCRLDFYSEGPTILIGKYQKEAHIKQITVISIESKRKIDFDLLLEYLEHYQRFVSIAAQEPVRIKNIYFYIKSKKINEPHKVPVVFLSKKVFRKKKDNITAADFLFTYDRIEDLYENLLNRWFAKKEKLDISLNSFFNTLYSPIFNVDIFLNTVKALEAYHREFINKDNVYQIDRYAELFMRGRKAFNPFLKIRSKAKFCRKIRDSRNDFTHNNPHKNNKKINYVFLFKITEQIKVILICNILIDLGIDLNRIHDFIGKSDLFLYVRKK